MDSTEPDENRSAAFSGAEIDDLVIVVPGDPVPWGPKQIRRDGHRFVPGRQQEAIGNVIDAVQRQHPGLRLAAEQPLKFEIEFYVKRPKGHYGTGRNEHLLKTSAPKLPMKRPDLSNLVKLIEDALVSAGLIPDDDQIAQITARKVFTTYGEQPRSVVRITAL